MKLLINILLLLTIGITWAKGQEIKDQSVPDKKKIELRPNSRDYGAVKRDNLHQRIDRKQNKAEFIKKKAALKQKRAVLKKNKAHIKRDKTIQRRQNIIQRRRALRN
jgi:hypothetical protein